MRIIKGRLYEIKCENAKNKFIRLPKEKRKSKIMHKSFTDRSQQVYGNECSAVIPYFHAFD